MLDLYRGRLSWRRLGVLASHLPRESSLVRELAGEPAEWGTTDYLLAHVADGIQYLLHAYVSANSKSKPRAPQPIPRPKIASAHERPKPMSTPNEVAAFFGAGSVNVRR